MKKRTALLLLCIVVSILFTGCGKDQVPASTRETAEQYGMLKIYSYKPDTLNPLYTKNNANLQMLRLIFEPLVICDEEQRPMPVLADSYSVADDGLAWTVNLKQNVKWHDGSPFTSADVEETYQEVLNNPEDTLFYDNLRNVDKILSLSDYTIVFNLKTPQTNFINLLNIPIIQKASEHAISNFSPVGTGPYQYAYKKNKSIYLKASQTWRGSTPPMIANIEVKLLPDKNTSVFAFEANEVDLVIPNMVDWSSYSNNVDNEITEYPSGNFNFIYLNRENPHLAKKEVREAIVYAINKNRINTEVLLSHGAVTDTIMNPNWWMYNGNAASIYEYNVKEAIERVLKADSDKKGIVLKLLVNDDNDIKFNVAGIIQDCLTEAGIETQVEFAPWEDFLAKIEQGSYDMYLGEMNYSPEVNPAYLLNGMEEYSALLDDLQKQTTEEGRKQAYYRIQEKVAWDIPLVPLYFDVESILYSSRISGQIRPLRDNVFYSIDKWKIQDK